MSSRRPRFLNPLLIRLPLNAWMSIKHRLSGVALAVLLPFLAWAFAASLNSASCYAKIQDVLHCCLVTRLMGLFLVLALFYHVLAGVRHMLHDMGLHSLRAYRVSGFLLILMWSVGAVMLVSCWGVL